MSLTHLPPSTASKTYSILPPIMTPPLPIPSPIRGIPVLEEQVKVARLSQGWRRRNNTYYSFIYFSYARQSLDLWENLYVTTELDTPVLRMAPKHPPLGSPHY